MADKDKSEDEKKLDAATKVLGEPVFLEFADATLKARRNLLAMGAIAVAFAWWHLELTTAPTVLGFQLQNLSTAVFAWGLLWSLVYLLLHFVWLAWDSLQEWRIRQTGSRLLFKPANGYTEGGAEPNDPRQATLYQWWTEQQAMLGKVAELMKDTAAKTQQLADMHKDQKLDDHTTALLLTIATNTAVVGGAVTHASTILEAHRVPASLERFEGAFRRFAKSQNLRWIALEFSVPVVVGIGGIVACICMLNRPAAAVAAPPPTTASATASGPRLPATATPAPSAQMSSAPSVAKSASATR